MKPFAYSRETGLDHALARGKEDGVRYLAGGTTLIDLMRLGVEEPSTVVDLRALPLRDIKADGDGVQIGALATNTEVAYHPLIAKAYPVLSEALLSGASPQLRNMASVGGNLLQRTRCSYFRDPSSPCNKRMAGSGCPALDGYNRSNAILGVSSSCIATHPSDMAVALLALDAVVHVRGGGGERAVPMGDFHVAPGSTPAVETALQKGEIITHVTVPASPFAQRSHYVKVRDRASYAFALSSAAVALDVSGGVVKSARVVLGGVATKPWRATEAEAELVGKPPTSMSFDAAGAAAVRGAVPRTHNAFKVELAKRTVARALRDLVGKA